MGAADFRVGGRIFATLASEDKGYGNLVLTPELQAQFVRELPDIFLPIHGGWGVLTFGWQKRMRTCWPARWARLGSFGWKRIRGRRRNALRGAAQCAGNRPDSRCSP